ncbi:hypothetical protein D0Z07_4036 [Hyphodiscus hymeniophilus]|uniref:Uncharacterized protein n=1 Tax=Hyphodiscus hymeniophilus TaxID=353542 RepID=A0A9P6VLQ2_9HELO|nr:hypothetical protein D0Z07_4036 [Hyphodiscus hymeniophilus]
MGGQAFTHLSTPRMPPSVYTRVLATIQAILKEHYQLVGSPIEAPGKDTYGDVDILVFHPLPGSPLAEITSRPELATQLSQYLGAIHHILGPEINFAIPWPSDENHGAEPEQSKYIQLDLKICSSEKMFQWELFHAAHGDLWNILGSTIRPYGITVNNRGFYLRISQIEKLDRKKSMVFLTDDHGLILDFLGLDKGKWWSKFGSRNEMFLYAAGCRMFWIKDLDELDAEEGTGVEGGENGKKKLKHNDRARMAKRPIFREWMEVFLPRCRENGGFAGGKGVTREQVRDEAFAMFGAGVQTEYETRLKEWNLAKHKDEIWRVVVKGSVPEIEDLQFRAASVRTLKGIVMEGETFKGKPVLEVTPNEEGFWDADKVRTFVETNWKEAGDIGWARQEERAREGMKAKAEKKKLLEEEQTRKNIGDDEATSPF